MAFERQILTRYDASTTGFDRGTRRVDQQLARLQRTADTRLGAIDRRFERAGRAARRFGAALAGLASVAALRRLETGVRNALSSLDNIANTAARLGLTTDALQELRSAAEQSGVAVGTFDMAMQRFGRRIAEARQGTGVAKGVIQEMGIALFDASGRARDIEDVLADVSNKMSEMTNQTDMNRIAMRLFDSEGVVLVNMLRNGAAGMEVMRQRARELGIVIDEDLIRRSVKANDELALISKVIESQMTVALAELGPTLVSLSQFFADLVTAVSGGEDSIIDLAAALKALAVGSAAVAGGRGIGAVTAAIREGAAARAAAVRESQALVATTQREVQARRLALATLQRETAQRAASAAGITNVAAANRRLASARTALTTAETQAAAATNALAVAQGRLSAATRITAGAMAALRGTMAFIGGVPGLLFAAAAAAIYFGSTMGDSAEQVDDAATSASRLNSAVDDVRAAQEAYSNAISATATSQGTATDSIVADTKREFEAKKALLELEIERQRSAQAERRAAMAAVEGQLGKIPSAEQVREEALRGGVPGRENLSEADRDRVIAAEIERAKRVADVRKELKQLRAEGELADIALESAERAVSTEFRDTGGGSGGGAGTGGGGRDERDAYADLIANAQERQRQLADEIILTRANAEEIAFLGEKQRLLAEARQAGVEVGAKEAAQIEENARAYAQLQGDLESIQAARDLINEVSERSLTIEEKIVAANERLAKLLPQIIELTGSRAEAEELLAKAQEQSEAAIRQAASGTNEWADAIMMAVRGADDLDAAFNRLLFTFIELASSEFFKSLFQPGSVKGGSGIFDALGSMLGTAVGGMFGGGGSLKIGGAAPSGLTPFETPKFFDTGGWTGGNRREVRGVVHGEEYVVRAGPARRYLPLLEAINRGVPGFASGGFVSPVVPTVPAMAAGSGGTTVQIIDQRKAGSPEIETSRERGPDGREIIRMVVADDMARGSYDKSMRGRYGARPSQVKY